MQSVEDGFRAADVLRKRGARVTLVKLGKEGCVLVNDNARLHVHPEPRKIVDATGAGDAFAGALMVALVERRPPRQAACFPAAAASIAVTRARSRPIRIARNWNAPRKRSQDHDLIHGAEELAELSST